MFLRLKQKDPKEHLSSVGITLRDKTAEKRNLVKLFGRIISQI